MDGDEVVGVSTYCDYPPAVTKITRVGSFLTPNVEQIIALLFMAVVYAIKDVPPGTYELAVWNPKLKAAPHNATVRSSGSTSIDFSLHR